ncbi:MAG TPA: acyl-CoA dehydrogenase family protein [Acidimicrobiales bacterium]|nr:acyl-CoA dehydrogenase family protein [Acidimicrobiales bacterium]
MSVLDVAPGRRPGDRGELARVAAAALAARTDDPTLGADLGWFGLGWPEEHGGYGSTGDLAVVVEAIGAAGAASAAGWTAGVAAPLLARAADPPADLLGRLAEGARLAVAATPPGETVVDGDRGRLSVTQLALGGDDGAAGLLLPIVIEGEPAVTVVPTGAPGVTMREVAGTDPTRVLTRWELFDVVVEDCLAVVRGPDLVDEWLTRVGLVAALDAVGLARTALTRTVAYAKERHQFGRAIGSFQAYKHRCADLLVELKLAQSLAFRAAEDLEAGHRTMALAAATMAPAAARSICVDAVQLHGGIGFTWEAGLHALLKRAEVDQLVAEAGGLTAERLLCSAGS